MAAVAHLPGRGHDHLTRGCVRTVGSRPSFVLGRLFHGVDVLRHRLAGTVVAALLDPAAELGGIRAGGVEDDVGGLRHRVGLDCQHDWTRT
jgi:hypothetical protein